jgi:digalactosyldiacylglycerol synthase
MHSVGIATTASVPWLTGTSIIPLFQAVYLQKHGIPTTLYVPWLPVRQQQHCYGSFRFQTEDALRDYIEEWLPDFLRSYCPRIAFYPAVYVRAIRSIGARVNLDRMMGAHDTVVLIDPAHLFAARPWAGIKKRRRHVLGIVMTNYEYYLRHYMPHRLARLLHQYNRHLLRRTCHELVAIAPVQPDVCSLPHCQVVPLNAADPRFGGRPVPEHREGAYFIGKLIPEKGLAEMFSLLQSVSADRIDLFGTGDLAWLRQAAQQAGISVDYRGLSLAPWTDLASYRIFVNCSRSEYLCSTTAQALAMQQWVILPRHPSNSFYYRFQNCLVYASPAEFARHYAHACANEPSDDPRIRELSWDVAIMRLLDLLHA